MCLCAWGSFNKTPCPHLWFRVVTAGILSQPLLLMLPTHTLPDVTNTWSTPASSPSRVARQRTEGAHSIPPIGHVSFVTVSTFRLLPLQALVHACLLPTRVALAPMTRQLLLLFWSAAHELPCKHTSTDLQLHKQVHPCGLMLTAMTTHHCNCDHVQNIHRLTFLS